MHETRTNINYACVYVEYILWSINNDLKQISQMGFFFMLCVCKFILSSGVICNVYGLFWQDKRYISIV